MKRVAILQSSYLPWKGYFDVLSAVDEFIVYDCAQYTKGDWRNRNQLKAANGKVWLSIPVRHQHLEQAVDEVEVADARCFNKHWSTFRQIYAKSPYIDYCTDNLQMAFQSAGSLRMLSEVNRHFLQVVASLLEISTPITDARNYRLMEGRNERLVSLCQQAGATHYLSGPAARSYLDEGTFAEAGIHVEWANYSDYPPYPQLHPPFDHFVSILDLIANTGDQARGFMKGKEGLCPS